MNSKILFSFQILFIIILSSYTFKEKIDNNFSYNYNNIKLEKCISLNIPCVGYIPSIWEIEQISGVSLEQAKIIYKILRNRPYKKEEFIKKLREIKGIGEKKSNKIAMLFYF